MTVVVMLVVGAAAYVAMAETLLARTDCVLDFEFRETAELLREDEDGLEPEDDDTDVPQAFLESFLLRVSDDGGYVFLQSPRLKGRDVAIPADSKASVAHFSAEVHGLGRHRLIAGPVSHHGRTSHALIAVSLAEYHRELADFRGSLLLVLPFAIIAAAASGYWLAGRTLRPIHLMTESARKISTLNLHDRIGVENEHDELGRLAATLNEVFDRLAHSLNATRRFTADASHELMTPLATIRTEAEVALQSPRTSAQYSEVLQSIVGEVTRLTRLAGRLLLLAREESTHSQSSTKLSVTDCLDSAVARIAPQAAQASIKVRCEPLPNAFVLADPEQLAQVFDNLLDNAVKYNRTNGEVVIDARMTDDEVVIVITDTGVGIEAEHLPRVFDRFFRVDGSRSRGTGGAGLGLNIVRTLVEAMGGRVELASERGVGTTFCLVFPRVDEN